MERRQGYVLRTIGGEGMRFVRLWFIDVVGQLKPVTIVPAELEEVFKEGIGFDGSSIQGMTRVYEDDVTVWPDAETFSILPWRGEDVPVVRMFCDVLTRDNGPACSDSRSIFRRIPGKAADMGFSCFVHLEIEFYLLHPENGPSKEPAPIDNSSYFDHVMRLLVQNFRRGAILTLEDTGTSIEFSHHEAGPGQNEIDLRSTNALRMADNVMTLKMVIEQTAIEQEIHTSLMLRPSVDSPGSGMHTHFLFLKEDGPAFYDVADPRDLSRTGQKFVVGFLRHAREITVVTNQYVNSYKRLYSGDEAPFYVHRGPYSRLALVRALAHSPNKP